VPEVRQVATLTSAPNADVSDLHERMGVPVDPGEVALRLEGDEAAAGALLRPCPEGLLVAREAAGVDWTGP
jgi:putative SOS response-associated peptidase YedK